MNPVLEKLLVLQDRDARLARVTTELDRIPEERAQLDLQENRRKESIEQGKTEARRIEADRKKLEMDVAAKEALVRKYKGQLLEIKNNDQFHALQHEIAAAEAEIRQIEDTELVLMERAEKAQAEVKGNEAQMREEFQRIDAQRKDLEQRGSVLEKQAADLKAERTKLAADIEEDVLSRYERIFRSKHGQAIVGISHGMCMGCHLKLTAQEIHNAQGDADLVTCTNCGRVLYWAQE